MRADEDQHEGQPDASSNGHSLADTDEAFPDETQEVRVLLEDCRRAHGEGDSAKLVELTAALLELPLSRCTDLVYMLRADALFEQNQYINAAECYRQGITHGADEFSMAWFKLGCCYAAEAMFEEAALAFWKAGELEPEEYMHRLQMGFALLELERFDDALEVFEQVLKMSGRKRGNYGIAWMHYARIRSGSCPQDKTKDSSMGYLALKEAVKQGELGEEGVADFPWWHAWINPAFEPARGTNLLGPPADEKWASVVHWPKQQGEFMKLRDVLLEQPEWE